MIKLLNTNLRIIKKNNKKMMLCNNEDYFLPNHFHKYYPLITGMPSLIWEKFRPWFGRSKITGKRGIGILYTPKDCAFKRIINYPIKRLGSPQIGFIGRYGYGKSRILLLIQALWLAKKHRILEFADSELECQGLLNHGYFTTVKNKGYVFHPFQLVLWIPKGYEFNTSAPNHKEINRSNFTIKEFTSAIEIVDNMKPHVLNVVYKEAFDNVSILKLLYDIILEIKNRTSRDKSYVFVTHEFGNLFPENPSGEKYKLIWDLAIEEIRKFRRHNIGILTSFHARYDVTYTINQKFEYECQVRPIKHKKMDMLEEEARNYKRGDVAISTGGGFRKHHINEFPVQYNEYRYAPNLEVLSYPELEKKSDIDSSNNNQKATTKELASIYIGFIEGKSARQLAHELNMTFYKVNTIINTFKTAEV